MPIGYGSNFPLAKLSSLEVSTSIEAQNESNLNFLSWVLTLVGIGAAFIPGIGAAGTAAIETGVAAGQEAIDISQGRATILSTMLNIAGPLIPAIVGGVKNIAALRKAGGIVNEVASAADKVPGANKVGQTFARKLRETAGKKVAINPFRNAERAAVRAQDAWDTWFNKQSDSFQELLANYVGRKAGSSAIQDPLTKLWDTPRSRLAFDFPSLQKAAQRVSAAGDILDEGVNQIRRSLSQAGLTAEEIEGLEEALKRITSQEMRKSVTIDYFRRIGKLDTLRKLSKEAVDTAASASTKVRFTENPDQWLKQYVRSLSRPSSAEFNDNFVQKVQLAFDGNDAGRAPIEFVYRKAKNYFNRVFKKTEDKIQEKMPRLGGIFAKTAKAKVNIEKLFEESGGILVNSEVVLGYKVIEDRVNTFLIQISFYPAPTRSKRNPRGKEPVYVFATKAELKHLRDQGMGYYLRKWATAKNGAKSMKKGLLGEIFGEAAGVGFLASFMKINALRNMLSLASNISSGFTNGISSTGAFTSGWRAKFASSFSRNWKNRLGRFGGRVLGGGAAGLVNKRLGGFVGRELQRISSQVVIPKLTGKRVTKKTILNALGTSVTSSVRRSARRRNPKSPALKTQTARRNVGIIQRIPGSLSGGRGAFSNLKF